MWVVISTSKELQFFDLHSDEARPVDGLTYFIEAQGHIPQIRFDHDEAVSKLLQAGIPLFVSKADARKKVTTLKSTGFKYLKLTPSIVRL